MGPPQKGKSLPSSGPVLTCESKKYYFAICLSSLHYAVFPSFYSFSHIGVCSVLYELSLCDIIVFQKSSKEMESSQTVLECFCVFWDSNTLFYCLLHMLSNMQFTNGVHMNFLWKLWRHNIYTSIIFISINDERTE